VIVDCHCHAGRGDGFTGPWDSHAPLGAYLRRAAAAGIERTVLFAAFHTDYRYANRQVAAIVRRRPDRFWGFAFLHPQRDAGRIEELVREAVREHGFRGLKVHRHDARITREICEVARAYRLPVLYDVMGETTGVELFARDYPQVSFIIPHLGSFADDWRAQRAFLDPLARLPNIYTDTSGVRRYDLLVEAMHRAGPDKILFGSDGPWLHPEVELAKVRLLGLPAMEEARITGGNLLRLLGKRDAGPPVKHRPRLVPHRPSPPVHGEVRDPWEPPREVYL
jgi:predicted TIM-barrel fold metal-dependent hydrolase